MILETKDICKRLRAEIKRENSGKNPLLCCIAFSDDGATRSYFRGIENASEKVNTGIKKEFLKGISARDVKTYIASLNRDSDVNGIIISRPLPADYQKRGIENAIEPLKDVDCVTNTNLGSLITGEFRYIPPTPGAVLEIIEEFSIETQGKKCVILGRSEVVGKPLALLLLKKGIDLTVTICHSRTPSLQSYTRTADIIITAIGSPLFLKSDFIRPGTVVIDVGINVKDGKLVGDVDFDDVKSVASMITPTPGGVGPVTTYILLQNVAKAFGLQERQKREGRGEKREERRERLQTTD